MELRLTDEQEISLEAKIIDETFEGYDVYLNGSNSVYWSLAEAKFDKDGDCNIHVEFSEDTLLDMVEEDTIVAYLKSKHYEVSQSE